jgi:pseudouridine-5'-phosphate glycosidase
MHPGIDVRPSVREALARGRPVVALESALIGHGLPYPDNLETALALQRAVRAGGAEPATIGVVGGRVRIGLSDDEIALFAEADGIRKASSRDLGIVCARAEHAATTVAATVLCARLAGIAVMGTGGIGGVHRDAATTMDISADLRALAATPIAVVCSGAKAILDLPRTMEVLETLGVPVIGYRTDRLPGFYTRSSGLGVDQRVDAADDAAAIMQAHWSLRPGGGLLIANPVPAGAAMHPAVVEAAIDQAIGEAGVLGVKGKAVTPFLLRRLGEMTAGGSLMANIALLRENARLAAEIAVAYARRCDAAGSTGTNAGAAP